ncbi:MAG: hypothetical protein QW035_04700 [Candidatus Anstonellales archaeon]
MALTIDDIKIINELIDKRLEQIQVRREDFYEVRKIISELAEAVKELAEAQRRTEERVNELAEAQRRTEERVNELAEAQRRTEERVGNLEVKMAELAEAQRRTEERVNELAEAQRRTENALFLLTREVKGLSDRIGFSLEDLGRELLPSYLEVKYGIKVKSLEPVWIERNGERIEINYYGKGKKGKREVVVLGESQSRIFKSDVEVFGRRFLEFEKESKKKCFKFLFAFSIHPSAIEVAEKSNINLIATYMLRRV